MLLIAVNDWVLKPPCVELMTPLGHYRDLYRLGVRKYPALGNNSPMAAVTGK